MPNGSPIQVTRKPLKFSSDDKRVIARHFQVGGEQRAKNVLNRVAGLSDAEVQQLLDQVIADFGSRHRKIENTFDRHFGYIKHYVDDPDALSLERKLLIGSYFTMEYAIESAALFNPSIVPHPDQSDLQPGELRFIMSLRATGEGHVSSIVFRTGVVDSTGEITFTPMSKYAAKMRVNQDRQYEKKLFFLKLIEMAAYTDAARAVLDEMPDWFTYHELDHKIAEIKARPDHPRPFTESAENMLWLARSNYRLKIPDEADPSEIVIFPTSENESRGIEDVRLTHFTDEDGSVTYFGTYTAYNGFRILPQLFETADFHNIEIHTLNGRYVQNKGMALFPRKINGFYHMISRLDGENMFIMQSDNVHFWNECQKLATPLYPWEFVQIGNCGPPIETEHGWLLLTHGVGPVRQYCIGSCLLDLDDPSKVIGHLDQPLIIPNQDERDGYVPNVVYSCGGLVHEGHLVIPYAMSDSATTFATVKMDELLHELTNNSKSCPIPDRRVNAR
ncbi:MAG: glycoside hydrolase family 130 protein [Planctomycetota bacterium]